MILVGHHLDGCVHQLLEQAEREPISADHFYTTHTPEQTEEDRKARADIEELCGLGGVLPDSARRNGLDGSVEFKATSQKTNEPSYIAYITYQSASQPDMANGREDVLRRMVSVCQRLCQAVRSLHIFNYACDSFTIPAMSYGKQGERYVQLLRIPFQDISGLLSLLEDFHSSYLSTSGSDISSLGTFQRIILTSELIVHLSPLQSVITPQRADSLMDSFAFLLQVYCVWLLSYCQAHTGHIRPSFLDLPLERITSMGLWSIEDVAVAENEQTITASLVELSCLGDMIRGPLLVLQ